MANKKETPMPEDRRVLVEKEIHEQVVKPHIMEGAVLSPEKILNTLDLANGIAKWANGVDEQYVFETGIFSVANPEMWRRNLSLKEFEELLKQSWIDKSTVQRKLDALDGYGREKQKLIDIIEGGKKRFREKDLNRLATMLDEKQRQKQDPWDLREKLTPEKIFTLQLAWSQWMMKDICSAKDVPGALKEVLPSLSQQAQALQKASRQLFAALKEDIFLAFFYSLKMSSATTIEALKADIVKITGRKDVSEIVFPDESFLKHFIVARQKFSEAFNACKNWECLSKLMNRGSGTISPLCDALEFAWTQIMLNLRVKGDITASQAEKSCIVLPPEAFSTFSKRRFLTTLRQLARLVNDIQDWTELSEQMQKLHLDTLKAVQVGGTTFYVNVTFVVDFHRGVRINGCPGRRQEKGQAEVEAVQFLLEFLQQVYPGKEQYYPRMVAFLSTLWQQGAFGGEATHASFLPARIAGYTRVYIHLWQFSWKDTVYKPDTKSVEISLTYSGAGPYALSQEGPHRDMHLFNQDKVRVHFIFPEDTDGGSFEIQIKDDDFECTRVILDAPRGQDALDEGELYFDADFLTEKYAAVSDPLQNFEKHYVQAICAACGSNSYIDVLGLLKMTWHSALEEAPIHYPYIPAIKKYLEEYYLPVGATQKLSVEQFAQRVVDELVKYWAVKDPLQKESLHYLLSIMLDVATPAVPLPILEAHKQWYDEKVRTLSKDEREDPLCGLVEFSDERLKALQVKALTTAQMLQAPEELDSGRLVAYAKFFIQVFSELPEPERLAVAKWLSGAIPIRDKSTNVLGRIFGSGTQQPMPLLIYLLEREEITPAFLKTYLQAVPLGVIQERQSGVVGTKAVENTPEELLFLAVENAAFDQLAKLDRNAAIRKDYVELLTYLSERWEAQACLAKEVTGWVAPDHTAVSSFLGDVLEKNDCQVGDVAFLNRYLLLDKNMLGKLFKWQYKAKASREPKTSVAVTENFEAFLEQLHQPEWAIPIFARNYSWKVFKETPLPEYKYQFFKTLFDKISESTLEERFKLLHAMESGAEQNLVSNLKDNFFQDFDPNDATHRQWLLKCSPDMLVALRNKAASAAMPNLQTVITTLEGLTLQEQATWILKRLETPAFKKLLESNDSKLGEQLTAELNKVFPGFRDAYRTSTHADDKGKAARILDSCKHPQFQAWVRTAITPRVSGQARSVELGEAARKIADLQNNRRPFGSPLSLARGAARFGAFPVRPVVGGGGPGPAPQPLH